MRRLLLLVILLNPACVRPADTARVIGVSDGDTLTVLRGRTRTRIRLHGIDAPETGQAYGSRAKQVASDLAFGKDVIVRPIDKDRYGRTVADVILPDGRSMNREMVGHGAAWWYRQYAPAESRLARLESEAKATRRGLWVQPDPVPPWVWRNGAATPIGVIGNRNSRVYHRPHCSSAVRMKERNRMPFKTAGEAKAEGYRRAEDCR
jgi:micrococcal nuclease